MPKKSSNSYVLRWPDRAEVERALRDLARREHASRTGLLRLGYFGSYARGDAGVGSDVDLVAVIRDSSTPFERRSAGWGLEGLPVPAEILVYTETEWEDLLQRGGRFARMLSEEVVWLEP